MTRLDRPVAEAIAVYRNAPGDARGVRAQRDVWASLRIDDTRHTLALTAVRLSEPQVRALLDDGVASRSGSFVDYAAAVGYARAVQWVHQQTEGLSARAEDAATLHEFSRGLVERVTGEFVPLPPAVALAAAKAVASVADPVPTVVSLGTAEAQCRAALVATAGGVALTRLVVNLSLVRAGCPPIVIHARDAEAYARLVSQSESDGVGLLGAFLARRLLDSVHRFTLSAQPTRLVSLSALATAEASADALRVAATRGRLRAQKGSDGVWRSRRRWVDDYLANRYVRSR